MSLKKTISNKVYNTIKENELFCPGDKVLVAFSGGADSVCLLYVLNILKEKLGIEIFAAHLNHGLRGEAADRDEKFAAEFSEKLGVKSFVFRENVREYAEKKKISEEAAGREIRYSLFFDVMERENISKLATGHHTDDRAETVLLHLMRGCGSDGLAGIRYVRGNVVRPLLDISKQEILDFCREENLEFCTDETNFETDYTRNKVRLELIPKMREFNLGIAKSLSNTSKIMSEESDFMETAAAGEYKKIVKENSCEIKELMSLHSALQRRVIMKMIEKALNKRQDISFEYVNDALKLIKSGKTGKQINICENVLARTEYGRLIIEKKKEESPKVEIAVTPGEKVKFRDFEFVLEKTEGKGLKLDPEKKFKIRNREPGDRIYLLGLSGSKKLKDFFIDGKIPRDEREKALVFLCGEDIAFLYCRGKVIYDRRFFSENEANFTPEFTKNY